MKKLLILLVSVAFLFAACTVTQDGKIEWGTNIQTAPCILHTGQPFKDFCAEVIADEGRTSLICQIEIEHGIDPCAGYRVIEIIAKEGTLFELYTEAEFNEWADNGIELVKTGITFDDLKAYLMAQVAKLNELLGAQIMIVGDMFIYIEGGAIISPDDALVMEAVFIDLKKEVHKMSIFVAD